MNPYDGMQDEGDSLTEMLQAQLTAMRAENERLREIASSASDTLFDISANITREGNEQRGNLLSQIAEALANMGRLEQTR